MSGELRAPSGVAIAIRRLETQGTRLHLDFGQNY